MIVARNIGETDVRGDFDTLVKLYNWMTSKPSSYPVLVSNDPGTLEGYGDPIPSIGRPGFLIMGPSAVRKYSDALARSGGMGLVQLSPLPPEFTRDWEREEFPSWVGTAGQIADLAAEGINRLKKDLPPGTPVPDIRAGMSTTKKVLIGAGAFLTIGGIAALFLRKR